MKMQPTLAPSLLAADFSNFQQAINRIHHYQAPWIHFDVMDGLFVPAITFGAQVVAHLRPHSETLFDVHLMVAHPERHIENFAQAGADNITFHIEATNHAHALVQHIHHLGCKAGVAINPGTSLHQLDAVLPFVDLVLVMSVNPGAGGQSFIAETLLKTRELQRLREEKQFRYYIQMDGGINAETLPSTIEAGTDILVAGSAFFSDHHIDSLLKALRG
ncbi:ribulose-phosphate 3-epimerase [Entomospira entomophila]|uniref:Ribulose-phosphate 3-epimerase n=1 Tax=Entomospira entomophila TaxID=2719988 RepID=A0A968KQS8_9SPIO|nr:ribulose-phosphate 3-epimerase [Entomospira entomophilus]NIZ40094.1 ribulose-phosphate 3-epimerase [Entomospira entomophilus]WDI36141.1 ribulose-phosphate 3-epimerase [Entomospira entomophilus]